MEPAPTAGQAAKDAAVIPEPPAKKPAADNSARAANKNPGQSPPWWGIPLLTFVFSVAAASGTLFLTSWVAESKARQEQGRLYARQKVQVRSAVRGLHDALTRLRLDEEKSPPFLRRELLPATPAQPLEFNRNDDYYQKYDLVDTVYRLCAVLGWMELYRQDPTFLSGPPDEKKQIEKSFRGIREALSEEFAEEQMRLRSESPASTWRDGVILEDDQRAIGEKMLSPAEKERSPSVIGYAAFCENLFRLSGETGPAGPNPNYVQNHWIWNATSFIVDIGRQPPAPDYRKRRLKKVVIQLEALQKLFEL